MSQAVERESMEVDVLYVGAGPATLASAIHLMNQIEAHNRAAEAAGTPPVEPPTVLVIEKGAEIGDHMLSGAVMNPKAIQELVPDFAEQGFPTEYVCDHAGFWIFHPKGRISSPFVPPNFQKKGYHIVSLNRVAKWLGERAETGGVEVYPGFAGDELLTEGDRVIGVRTGDMGVDKDGNPKSTFSPGMDIFAKVTVLGEGARGSLAKQLIERFGLQGRNPQTFETGVKEIWKIDPKKHQPGRVVHGLSFPKILRDFHGMWLYDMQDDLISYGFVTPLDSESPHSDPHLEAQKFKTNPWMKQLLEGAELVNNMCNAQNLAGIHQAMKTGMLAAETIIDALAHQDFTSKTLGGYAKRYRESWAYQEHYQARNFAPSAGRGFFFFMLNEPLRMITGGRGLFDDMKLEPGYSRMKKLGELPAKEREKEPFEFDGSLTFDKEHLVEFSGTAHESDQPPHLVVADVDVCSTTCAEEYGNPCESFCPASVYEMLPDPDNPERKKLFIHHENCVHCKTCDIADPYQIITWTPPEGGEGPSYDRM
jgi:electron-transferring-flavoprotein dehydrogenase